MAFRIVNTKDALTGPLGTRYVHDAARPFAVLFDKGRGEMCAGRYSNEAGAKQPCEVCGAEKSEAHHDDYTKPLSVRWLCRSHHRLHHEREYRAADDDRFMQNLTENA